MRRFWSALGALALVGLHWPAASSAEPVRCDDPSCVPGINRVVALGADCDNVTYFVFATTDWGRVVFCDSTRGLSPRYFRAMPVAGIRDFDTPCDQPFNQMAQAPDGLFLFCGPKLDRNGTGESRWIRGDHYDNPNSNF